MMTPLSPTRATFHVLAAKASRYHSSQVYGLGWSALPLQGPSQCKPDGSQSAVSILGHKSSAYHSIPHSQAPPREQVTRFPAACNVDGERSTTAFTTDLAPPHIVLPSHLCRLSRVAPIAEYKRRATNLSEDDEMKLFSFLEKIRPRNLVSHLKASPTTLEPSPPPHSLWKRYLSAELFKPPLPPASLTANTNHAQASLSEEPWTSPLPPSPQRGVWRQPAQPDTIAMTCIRHTPPRSSATTSSQSSNTDSSYHQGSDAGTDTTHSCECCNALQRIKEIYFSPKDVAPEAIMTREVTGAHSTTSVTSPLAPTPAGGSSSAEDKLPEHGSISLTSGHSQVSHPARQAPPIKAFPDYQCPPSPSKIPLPRDPYASELGPSSMPFSRLASPAPDRVKAVFAWRSQGPTPPSSSPPLSHIQSQDPSRPPYIWSSSREAALGEVPAVHYDDYGVPRYSGVRFDREHPLSLAPPAEDLFAPPDYIFPSPRQWKAAQPQHGPEPEFPPGLSHLPRQGNSPFSRIASPSDPIHVAGSSHPPPAAIGSKVDDALAVHRAATPICHHPRPVRTLHLEGLQRIREWEFSDEELREFGVDQCAPRRTPESLVPHWMLHPWWKPQGGYWKVQ